jgi:AraC-like DNA-binding protein
LENNLRGCILNKQDHLALRLARIKSPEEVEQSGEGLFFLFSKGGTGKFTSKNGIHRLSAGDVLVFNGAAGSKLSVFDNKKEFLYWTFSACFENLLPLFSSNEISLLHNITEGFKATKIYPASSALAAECQRLLEVVPPQFNLDHRGQLVRIAATILSVEFKEGQSQRSGYVRTEDNMIQIFEKLSASELINLSVGDLADRFNCSRRHLNRLFHQHFGVSVAALRMEMRLLKAISLLRDADMKIINVAEQCGFNHLGLFNTCFKRRFGSSPGQWRKSTLQAADATSRKTGNKPEKPTRCPLQTTGLCPMVGKLEVFPPSVVSTIAGKITGGVEILEDLKRRDLTFGSQSLSNMQRKLAEAKEDE